MPCTVVFAVRRPGRRGGGAARADIDFEILGAASRGHNPWLGAAAPLALRPTYPILQIIIYTSVTLSLSLSWPLLYSNNLQTSIPISEPTFFQRNNRAIPFSKKKKYIFSRKMSVCKYGFNLLFFCVLKLF